MFGEEDKDVASVRKGNSKYPKMEKHKGNKMRDLKFNNYFVNTNKKIFIDLDCSIFEKNYCY